MSELHNQFNSSTFNNTVFDYGGKKIPKALGGFPVSPNVFIGRENNTKLIHEKLSSKTNQHLLLLVNGKGGIGKTTMASQYYFEYAEHYSHLIWLVSETGISDAIMSLALSLDIRFENNMTQAQKIREIIRVISTLKRPVLIIIDNANSLEDLDTNNQILRQFHNTHILLTSRIEKYEDIPTHKINHLDELAANTLFKHYYKAFKEEEQALLDAVLEAIGYNTLVIELLSKNLNKFNSDIKQHYPLQKLLEDIQKKGVLAISKSAKVRSDYKLQPATSEAIISTMYDISELSEAEKQLLSIFGVLPATAIPFHHLEQFLPNIEMLDLVLRKLVYKGWIDYDKALQSYKTNPIISEIVRAQNKGRIEKDTQSFVYFLGRILQYQQGIGHIDGDFNEIKKNISYAETLIHNFLYPNYSKSIVLERLGNFYRTYGNLDKALWCLESFSKLSRKLCEDNPTNLAFKYGLGVSYDKLGDIYTMLGNLDKALYFYEEYLELFKKLTGNFPTEDNFKNNLAISYSKLGNTHTSLNNLDKALKLFEEFKILTMELCKSNPNSEDFHHCLAISYEKLGETYMSLENLTSALYFFKERSKLSKALYDSNSKRVDLKNSLIISYEKLGEIYTLLGNFEKALEFFKIDLKLTKELCLDHPTHLEFKNGLAIANIKLGELFFDKLNKKEKGISYLQKAEVIWKELTTSYPSYADFQNNYKVVVKKLKSLE